MFIVYTNINTNTQFSNQTDQTEMSPSQPAANNKSCSFEYSKFLTDPS